MTPLLIGKPVCNTRLARGLISAALLVVLLSLACGGSSTPGRAPSNLTAEQRARLQDFAESVEADGDLRPVLPNYLPSGLDPLPEIIDSSKNHIALQFSSTPDESSEKTAVPLYLEITRVFEPMSRPFFCGDGPNLDVSNLEDYDLGGRDLKCVHLDGRPAELQYTEHGDGTVQYSISFELDDLDIYVSFVWKRGQDASRESEEQMKKETLRVAVSMIAP